MMGEFPIPISQRRVTAALPAPPICLACAEGEHEHALRAHERCSCPCHGIAMPQAVAA